MPVKSRPLTLNPFETPLTNSSTESQLVYANTGMVSPSLPCQFQCGSTCRITSYNVCYTKLLRNNLSDTIGVGGEQVVECQVLDYKGKPVEDVDITALSTAFSMMPLYLDLPKYEKLKEPISPNSNYWSKDVYQRIAMLNAANLDRYRNKLRVDSIDYFKFIYPKDGFFVQSVSKVAVTQVSPYIVDGGIIQKVHYVKINNELKYVGAANTSNPYSFTVMPGKLKIEVRTNNHLITITDYARNNFV